LILGSTINIKSLRLVGFMIKEFIIYMKKMRGMTMNNDRLKRIIIENIKHLEYKDRVKLLKELVEMFESEMLIFGESK